MPTALSASFDLPPFAYPDESDPFDIILSRGEVASWFQPIVDLQEGGVIGYEALIRGPADSPLHSPLNLFDAALRRGRLTELELLCREKNVASFVKHLLPGKLFLNVSPEAFLDPHFPIGFTRRLVEEYQFDPARVVIELTEQQPIEDYQLLQKALLHYRAMGFSVALDDLGTAYAGLRNWSELNPNYVKFDKHFIQGIDEDRKKQQFIQSLLEIARHLGSMTIAEGIETRGEYQLLQSLGVQYGQGYYFDRPSPNPRPELPKSIFLPKDQADYRMLSLGQRSETMAGLVRSSPTITPATLLQEVGDLFEQFPERWFLPVVEDHRPVGGVSRYKVLDILGSRYGRDLYGRNPIRGIMDIEPVLAERDMPVEKFSQILTSRVAYSLRDDFIITDQGLYFGTGTVIDLLRKVTDLQICNARYANPLTQLPGNVPISERLNLLIEEGREFFLCHFDIDNFKPYNDCYGFSRGDEVIRLLGNLLVEEVDPAGNFIGHIGGDDFVVIFTSSEWEGVCRGILERFAREILTCYDPEALSAGGIFGCNRKNQEEFFEIMSLSIGAVTPRRGTLCSPGELASRAAEAKTVAKQMPGNALFIDRRQIDGD